MRTHNIDFTQELHKIRAHLLYYISLLEDFRNSIKFIRSTPNPVMEFRSEEEETKRSQNMLLKECDNLLTEIDRLELNRKMEDERLKNVMDLVRLCYTL